MITLPEVLNLLKSSSAYNPSVPEKVKKSILLDKAWDECLVLSAEFGSDGTKETVFNGSKSPFNGFGELVEVIARHDPNLPKNSVVGERLAQTILKFLRKGSISKSRITFNGPRRIPDQILVNFNGRRADIVGIYEVKASHISNNRSEKQIAALEHFLRQAVDIIEEGKHNHPDLKKIKILVRNPLRKILITPAGFRKHVHLLPGWEHKELKFTYNELIFIAQQIWPDFRPEIAFEDNLLGKYREGFLNYFLEWGRANVLKGITTDDPDTAFMFACATQKLPQPRDLPQITEATDPIIETLVEYPSYILREEDLGDWERDFFYFFTKALGGGRSIKDQTLLFITNFRLFSIRLAKICRDKKDLTKILARSMDFNIINYCPK